MPDDLSDQGEPARRPWATSIAVALFVVGATLLMAAVIRDVTGPHRVVPCSEMANVLSKDLPARCTKNYDPTK